MNEAICAYNKKGENHEMQNRSTPDQPQTGQ